jgi:hypothetical protein
MNAFFSDLENIGKNILKGIEAAAPILSKLAPVSAIIPVIGPALSEVATVITQLEASGSTITASELETMIVTLVSASQIKTAAKAGTQ